MTRIAQILLEYLPPHKAEEMMVRLHSNLSSGEGTYAQQLNALHRELNELSKEYVQKLNQ